MYYSVYFPYFALSGAAFAHFRSTHRRNAPLSSLILKDFFFFFFFFFNRMSKEEAPRVSAKTLAAKDIESARVVGGKTLAIVSADVEIPLRNPLDSMETSLPPNVSPEEVLATSFK